MKNVFSAQDGMGQQLTIDEMELASGKRVWARVFDEGELVATVELSTGALLDLRFKIDEYVTEGGGF